MNEHQTQSAASDAAKPADHPAQQQAEPVTCLSCFAKHERLPDGSLVGGYLPCGH